MERFITKARAVHGDKYDYSKVHYTGNQFNVTIICPQHGSFEQSPKNHTNKKCGCPVCSRIIPRNKPVGLEGFIEASQKVHGNKYNYSQVVYTDNKAKVIIGCPKHGDFKQITIQHSRGHGCPRCKRSKGEEAVASILNKLGIAFKTEKTFDDCRGLKGRKMKFDFYIESLNAAIEYDGHFHFRPYKAGDTASLAYVQENDDIKTFYCQENGISLLRIHHQDFANIESIVTKKFTNTNMNMNTHT